MDTQHQAMKLLAPLIKLSERQPWGLTAATLREKPQGRALLSADPAVRAEAYPRVWELWTKQRFGIYNRNAALICGLLEDSGLQLSSAQLLRALHASTQIQFHERPAVGGLIELMATAMAESPSAELELACRGLRAALASHPGLDPRQRLLDQLLGEDRAWSSEDAWGQRVDLLLANHPQAAQWTALLEHCADSGERSKPTRAWLKKATPAVAEISSFDSDYRTLCQATLMGPVFENCQGYDQPEAMRRQNRLTLRALVWASAGQQSSGPSTAELAQRCFRKIPMWGAGAEKLGNACLWALGELPGTTGVMWLSTLAGRVRYKKPLRLIEKALEKTAARVGVSREEVVEMSLPHMGLNPQGQDRVDFDAHHAILALDGSRKASLRWFHGDKPQRSVPKAVKDKHPQALKELKARHKELSALMAGQVDRIEALYLQDRDWPLNLWAKRYLNHPLLSGLTRRLVWQVGASALLPVEDGFINAQGDSVQVEEDARVRLWHPISTPELASAWRGQLAKHGICQPFRQAHRAVYRITPAELEAGDHSARFAGQLLRQHQFVALARERGWNYRLQGPWDSHNVPSKSQGPWSFSFSVQGLDDGEDGDSSTGYPFLSTGLLHLMRAGELQALEGLPPLLFSELMRDVDLFVGVCSVGTDPDWATRDMAGPDALERWHSWAMGDLSEQAKMRKQVISELIPVLKIGPKLGLEERFLTVQGRERRYKIHLGSGNIFVDPGTYLCVVASPRRQTPLALPFEGDNMLSLILSKALMLVDDHKIKDMSIRRQLRLSHEP